MGHTASTPNKHRMQLRSKTAKTRQHVPISTEPRAQNGSRTLQEIKPEEVDSMMASFGAGMELRAHGLPFDFLTSSVDNIVDVPFKGKRIKARLLHVVDGDTVCVAIYCGHMLKVKIRLSGIDTPELHPKGEDLVGEAKAAEKVKQYVCGLCTPHSLVDITLLKVDKYGGRYVGHLHLESGETLSQHLLTKGYAKSYDGRAKVAWVASDFDAINSCEQEQ